MLFIKRIVLFSLFLWSFSASAHDFYFAFAEVKYNEISERIEVAISLTSHDLEKNLALNGVQIQFVSGKDYTDQELESIETILNQGFELKSSGKAVQLELEGMDIQLNGTTHFFMSAPLSNPSDLSLTFDLLMDTFSDQQNKMNFIYRNRKDAYVFLPNQPTKQIELNRNDQ
jgi:hypothetical protein